MTEFGMGIAATLGFWAAITILGVAVGLWLIFRKEYRLRFRSLIVLAAGAVLMGSPLGMIPFGVAIAIMPTPNASVLSTAYAVLWLAIVIWLFALWGIAYAIDRWLKPSQRNSPEHRDPHVLAASVGVDSAAI